MTPKKPTAIQPASSEISFRKDLLIPAQSQVTQYEDQVTDRVRQLDGYAAQLGRGFGLPFTPGMELNPTRVKAAQSETPQSGWEYFGMLVLVDSQRVSLERREGQWGLYYTHSPNVFLAASKGQGQTVPLRDAPLDVRELFLLRAEEFFRAYLATCENRLGSMQTAVDAGDRTLALLKNMQLR